MSNIFDDFYENLPKGRCHPCKYAKAINAGDDWVFLSCWHEPYQGKRVTEIKDCPMGKKSMKVQENQLCWYKYYIANNCNRL